MAEELAKPLIPVEENPADDNDDAPKADDEDTGAHVAPIVKLEEVAVVTGEEDEKCLYENKSKLYRYDPEARQWKERGIGQVKLLEHIVTHKIRLVMRQSKTLKICANHTLAPGMTLQEHGGSDKSWVWHAQDFADGELKKEMLCIKFGSVENAQSFKSAFEDAVEKMKTVAGPTKEGEANSQAASDVASVLDKLSVGKEETKTEEKTAEKTKDEEKKTEEPLAS